LRIQISNPFFFSLFGIAHRMAANLIERSNRLPIGAPDLPVDPVSRRQPPKNRGLNVGDVASPSSFEGRGELKKRTNFI
jgi:hypothetical protein